MLPGAFAMLAVAHAAASCSAVVVGGIEMRPWPAFAGEPATICANPYPGPEPRTFEWDLGQDGSVDATTSEPKLDVPSLPPGSLAVTLRYPNYSNLNRVEVVFPIQPARTPAPTGEPATIRVENDTLIYQGTAGGRDSVYFSVDQPHEWHATGAVEPGPGCTRKTKPTAHVSCPPTHNAQLQLGDHGRNIVGIDFLTDWKFGSVTVTGGAGSDNIRALAPGAAMTVDGGPGNDTLASSGEAFGGPGDDRVTGYKKAVGGDGNDRVVGSSGLVDGGPGNDTVEVHGIRVNVLLGPGNDVFIGDGIKVGRVYGGAGNDLFRVPVACICGLFGEAGNDTFHSVTSLIAGAGPARSQLVLGGPGRDTGVLDGSDCARGVERVTRTKLTRSDSRYRCKPPSVNLRP